MTLNESIENQMDTTEDKFSSVEDNIEQSLKHDGNSERPDNSSLLLTTNSSGNSRPKRNVALGKKYSEINSEEEDIYSLATPPRP